MAALFAMPPCMNPRPLLLLLAFLALAYPSTASLVNRWSFNQPAAPAGAGLVINDSLAGMPLTVRGLGATLDDSRIVLPGTTTSGNPNSTISAYLDLPNGLVSSKTSITVEIWAAPISARTWQPLFEFGRMDIAGDRLGAPGEWTGNGNTGPAGSQGRDLLGCSFNQNLNLNSQYQVVFNGMSLPAANVRTEFFSIGLRNPFRFSIDATTAEIWLGDVGQNAREEVNLATNGANFGWSWREGSIAGPNAGEALPGFTYTNPLYEYSSGSGPFQGHSVTGGVVYRGANLPALTGTYIFGDYQDGNLWALRRNGAQTTIERLTGDAGQVAFHADPSNGDVLMVDIQENRILRLIAGTDTGNFPATLSATNLFADLSTLSPAPGLLPYTPNLSFWSDHAIKRRWFIVPDALGTMTCTREGAWTYPEGTIWVKHFDLETTRGNPATAQRIETRLLVKNSTGSYGVSYRWNPAQTEATIVADAGADFPINVIENGIPRIQNYRIPSRSQCLTCHNPAAGHALSFNTRQLNLSANINGFTGNQLDLLTQAGYFSNTPVSPNLLPRHLRPTETAFPLETRVRSYLDVNCANCHRSGGSAPASWDGRAPLTLTETLLIHGAATNSGGDILNRLIVPGDPTNSIVLSRVSLTNGFTRMPPLGSSELDQSAISLLTEWISTALPAQQTYAQWRLAQFGSSVSAIGEPQFDADFDGHSNYEEFLANTAPQNAASLFTPSILLQGNAVTLSATLPANRSCQIETSTDLGNWQLWDMPGNGGLPTTTGSVNFTGPASSERQFFRFLLREN